MHPKRTIALQVFFFILTSTLIGLRFWAVKIRRKQNASSPRQMRSGASIVSNVAISLIFLISVFGEVMYIKSAINQIRYGNLTEEAYRAMGVPRHKIIFTLKINFISKFIYITLIWLCKTTFIAFYYDCVRFCSNTTKLMLYTATVYTGTTYVAAVLLTALWCRPIKTNWSLEHSTVCSPWRSIPNITLLLFFNVSTDMIIMIIPMSFLHRPAMLHVREKSGIAFIFLLGILTISAAVTRYAILRHILANPNDTLLTGTPVETFDMLGQLECLMAFIATCLPSLRILLFEFWTVSGTDKELYKKSLMERMDLDRSRIVLGELNERDTTATWVGKGKENDQ